MDLQHLPFVLTREASIYACGLQVELERRECLWVVLEDERGTGHGK